MAKIKKYFTKDRLKEYAYITIGVILVAFAFSFFLDPNNLVIGGATGLATIFKNTFGWDTALTVLLVNAILLIIGLFLLGKQFFIKTIYGSLSLPVFIKLFNMLYNLIPKEGNKAWINDKMLVILFSALIIGLGIGIVMKNGGTTGGTEIPQQIMYKYFHIPFSVSLWMFDGVVVLVGAFLIHSDTQSFDPHLILYALIFIYISGLVMDQIVFSGFNSRAVYIISNNSEKIKERILKDFGRGVTEVQVVGGYTKEGKTKLICILSSSEYYRLKGIIQECDPSAFYYVVRASEVNGEGFSYK